MKLSKIITAISLLPIPLAFILGQVIITKSSSGGGSGSGITDLTGEVTATGPGSAVATIANDVIVDDNINSSAAIAWSKLSKTGSSLADLTTKSAGDLSTGTLSDSRLSSNVALATDFYIGGLLKNAVFVQEINTSVGIGDNDFYTVPASKRAIVSGYGIRNVTGGTVDHYLELKSGGNYYRVTSTSSTATGFSINLTLGTAIFEAGDSVSMNVATTAGATFWLNITEFDDTSPLKSARVLGPSSGDNTAYTVPVGKTAIIVNTSPFFISSTSFSQINFFCADSVTTRTIFVYVTPSGGSQLQLTASTSVSASTRSTLNYVPPTLTAGDILGVNVNVGAATQIFQVAYIEK